MTDTVESVKRIINGRTVAVAVPGPSIAKLLEYSEFVSDYDWCWVGIPKWWYIEKNLLAPFGKQIDIIWTGCTLTINSEKPWLEEFLSRDKDNLFVTKPFGYTAVAENPSLISEKTVLYEPAHVNAISAMLVMLRKACAKRVIIFGMDGQSVWGKLHYGEEDYRKLWSWYGEADPVRLAQEAKKFDLSFEHLCSASGATYPTEFINCSEYSAIECFRKFSYASLGAYLNE